MMEGWLNLKTVQVAREATASNGMGGVTTSTTLTTLASCAIWQGGSSQRYLSQKQTRDSSHTLVTRFDCYAWTRDDMKVVDGNRIFKIVGEPDDLLGLHEFVVVALELQS